MMTEIWIGDYSCLIWIPKGSSYEEKVEIIKDTVNLGISAYGLKVVKA